MSNTLGKVVLMVVAGAVVAGTFERIVRAVKWYNSKDVKKDENVETPVATNQQAVKHGAVHYFYYKDLMDKMGNGNNITPFEVYEDSPLCAMVYGKDVARLCVYVAEDGRLFAISTTEKPHPFITDIVTESTPLDWVSEEDKYAHALVIQNGKNTEDTIDKVSSHLNEK